MKPLKCDKKRMGAAEWLGMALFAVCAGVVLYIAFRAVPVLIESDAASDMLQARFAPLLSVDWYYANGLSVLNFQWLRWLLLRFIGNWGAVRSILFVVTVSVTLLCAYYLLKQTGLGRRDFWLTASVLLFFFILQPSEKQQYTTILSCTFLVPALMLRVLREKRWSRGRVAAFAALLLLTLLGGISATRLLISLFLPLMLAGLFMVFLSAEDTLKEGEAWRTLFKRLDMSVAVLAALLLAVSFIGVALGKKLIWPLYNVQTATGIQLLTFVKPQAVDFGDVVMRYFAIFGYVQGVPVISRMGLGNMCALLLGVTFPALCLLAMLRAKREGGSNARAVLFLGTTCFALLIIAFFPMLFTTLARFDRYYLPACALFAVLLSVYASQRAPMRIRQALIILVLGVVLCCAVLSAWLTSDGEARLTDRTTENEMLSYLEDNGYSLGYAPYWHASVNTERTDGRVLIAPIVANEDENGEIRVSAYRWLTVCHAFDEDFMLENGRLFLLLPTEGAQPREKWNDVYAGLKEKLEACDPALPECAKVFENDAYAIYELPEGARFAEDGLLMQGGEPG